MSLRISQLARTAGTTPPTIRYYEKIGLLPPARRRATGHREYDEADVGRLTFIRRCRALGLSIPRVRALLAIADDGARAARCCEHCPGPLPAPARARAAKRGRDGADRTKRCIIDQAR